MKSTLQPGLRHTHRFTVTEAQTVPALYPESPLFRAMPPVFATGYLVGFLEWACIELLAPHLDEGEQSVGTHIDTSHSAATPVGMIVTAEVELEQIDGRRFTFRVSARDEHDVIAMGRHERVLIDPVRFRARMAAKAG